MIKYSYLEKEIELGEIIEINGFKTIITQELIDLNPESIKIIYYKPKYIKCISSSTPSWSINSIYPILEYSELPNVITVKNNYGIAIIIYDFKSVKITDNKVIYSFEPLDENETKTYELFQELKKKFPIGCRYKSACNSENRIYEVISNNFEIYNNNNINVYGSLGWIRFNNNWAEIIKPLFKTEDGVDIYENDNCYFVRYGTLPKSKTNDIYCESLNEIGIVKFKNRIFDADAHLVYKYFSKESNAIKWVNENTVKTLSDYQNILLESSRVRYDEDHNNKSIRLSDKIYYKFMKENEPKFYWLKVLEVIANDLNGDWKREKEKPKWMIGIGTRSSWKAHAIKHETVTYSDIYFKTEDIANKAIKIMGKQIYKTFE